MRKLSQELGGGTMSLYNHIANKDDLLDGMIDAVFSEVELPAKDEDWRTAMRERDLSLRAAMLAHPWAVGLMESRRTPGPATLRHHDAVIGCFLDAGFSLELTRIGLAGGKYWSLGIEAAPDAPGLLADLLRALGEILQGFPIPLPRSCSRSYPRWLLDLGDGARRTDP